MGLLPKRKTSRTAGASDPAKLLITEHQKVERLFEQLHAAGSPNERAGLVAQLDAELAAHTAKEEAILYPWIARHVPKGGGMVDHANHEHGLAKQALADLVSMDPGDEGLLAVATRLQGLVEAHVKEEEKAIFPALAKSAGGEQLAALRGELEAAKFAPVARALPDEAAGGGSGGRSASRGSGGSGDGRSAGSRSEAASTLASSDAPAPAKKAAAKRLGSATRAAPAKKAAAKEAAAKKAAARKAAAKKAPAKKAAATKAAGRRR